MSNFATHITMTPWLNLPSNHVIPMTVWPLFYKLYRLSADLKTGSAKHLSSFPKLRLWLFQPRQSIHFVLFLIGYYIIIDTIDPKI